MFHIPGDKFYDSNLLVFVKPLPQEDEKYTSSSDALDAVVAEFDINKASGTFYLQENWLGESHAHVYRRVVPIDIWDENIQITYYLLASTTSAYMIVETVYLGSLTGDQFYMFNQVVTSFRITENEDNAAGPGLEWGTTKPGGDEAVIDSDSGYGEIEEVEEFLNNDRGWPASDASEIQNGYYTLDSRDRNPFTVHNTALGTIGFDFSYEGQVTFKDGDLNGAYGLVYGYRDSDNYFAFLIAQNDRFLVIEERDGEIEYLAEWTESDLLDGDSHTLMVQGDYQTLPPTEPGYRYVFGFYVDGENVGNAEIRRIHDVSGYYGVFVSRDLEVTFDWLKSRNYLIDSAFSFDRVFYD